MGRSCRDGNKKALRATVAFNRTVKCGGREGKKIVDLIGHFDEPV
jgi:hypothetical protein